MRVSAVLVAAAALCACASAQTLLAFGSKTWKYYDGVPLVGNTWRDPAFVGAFACTVSSDRAAGCVPPARVALRCSNEYVVFFLYCARCRGGRAAGCVAGETAV
jgi:hypothetical protein